MHNKAMEMAKSIMDKACVCGYDNLNSQDWDDFKDAMEVVEKAIKANYYYKLIECMEKDKEEEKREDAYFLKMLKEEYKDEYKKMKDEYGEDEGERRFYDNYRYANGRFAPKGRGSYRPRSGGRRGYEEMVMPIDYMIPPEMYNPEMMRDMDRMDGRMYYSGGGNSGGSSGGGSYSGNSGGNSGGNSSGGSRGYSGGGSSSGGNGGNSGGSTRSYTEGYNDGEESGYQRGYSEGNRDGRRNNGGNNSRYDRAKRGFEETKQAHSGNTPEDKQITMKEAEKFVNVFMDGLEEALEDSPTEVKNMVKSKVTGRMQKMQ